VREGHRAEVVVYAPVLEELDTGGCSEFRTSVSSQLFQDAIGGKVEAYGVYHSFSTALHPAHKGPVRILFQYDEVVCA
jgi:hypothetical protein